MYIYLNIELCQMFSVDVVLVVSQKHMRRPVSVTMATSSSVHLGRILKIYSILIHVLDLISKNLFHLY